MTPADLAAAFTATWNAHDMGAFAALFSADAEFVNVYGMRSSGRPAIEAAHRAIHASVMAKSTLTAISTQIKPLGNNAATILITWTLEGIVNPAGTPQPDRKGIITATAAKGEDGWKLVQAQNTDTVPPPGPPKP